MAAMDGDSSPTTGYLRPSKLTALQFKGWAVSGTQKDARGIRVHSNCCHWQLAMGSGLSFRRKMEVCMHMEGDAAKGYGNELLCA